MLTSSYEQQEEGRSPRRRGNAARLCPYHRRHTVALARREAYGIIGGVRRLHAKHPGPHVPSKVGHRRRLLVPRIPYHSRRRAALLDHEPPVQYGIVDHARAARGEEDAIGGAAQTERLVRLNLPPHGVGLVDVGRPRETGDRRLPHVSHPEIRVQRFLEPEWLVGAVLDLELQHETWPDAHAVPHAEVVRPERSRDLGRVEPQYEDHGAVERAVDRL